MTSGHESIRHHDEAAIRLARLRSHDRFESGRVTNRCGKSDAAAALNELRKLSMDGIVAGLNSTAARLTPGAISLSNSSHLPAIVGSSVVKPVALPPGRERLATKPLPTG